MKLFRKNIRIIKQKKNGGIRLLKIVIPILIIILLVWKFYNHRQLFRELTKREWIQYIAGFIVAWGVAMIIIIGGRKIVHQVQISWLNDILAIVFILLGLLAAGYIMEKTVPQKLRSFYFK